jgi:hypothetical protein
MRNILVVPIIGFSFADILLLTILMFAFRWNHVHDVDVLRVTCCHSFQRDEMARNAVLVSTKLNAQSHGINRAT